MLLMSQEPGSGCDTQFLFSWDIMGDYEERLPRHAPSPLAMLSYPEQARSATTLPARQARVSRPRGGL